MGGHLQGQGAGSGPCLPIPSLGDSRACSVRQENETACLRRCSPKTTSRPTDASGLWCELGGVRVHTYYFTAAQGSSVGPEPVSGRESPFGSGMNSRPQQAGPHKGRTDQCALTPCPPASHATFSPFPVGQGQKPFQPDCLLYP